MIFSSMSMMLFALFVLSDWTQPAIPDRLARLLNERAGWSKTDIRCIRHAPEEYSGPRQFGFTSVGGDHLQTDFGDEEGVVIRNEQGEAIESGFGPVYSLRRGGELWYYKDGDVHADLFEGVGPLTSIDARSFGVYCAPHVGTLEDAIIRPFGMGQTVEYTQRAEGNGEVIIARNGDKEMAWHFDDASAGAPSKVVYTEAGRIMAESRSVLGKYDNRTFPTRIEYYKFGYRGGVEPFNVMEIQSLDVNSPNTPNELNLEAIHIDAGINVTIRQEGAPDKVEMRRWTGTRFATLEEANDAERKGVWISGPHVLANRQRARDLMKMREESGQRAPTVAGDAGATSKRITVDDRPPSLAANVISGWEAYTRRFIARYRLNGDQTDQALRLLRNCESEAQEWIQRHPDDYDQYENTIARMRAGERGASATGGEMDRLRAKLLEPLDDIFERTLKPRLNAIPTTQQRRNVEGVLRTKATSRPASK